MKKIAGLALAALSAPAAAFAGGPVEPAADVYVEQPAPVIASRPDTDWGGFYVGGQLGWGNFSSEGSGLGGNGVLGGVHAGYRYDFGRAVVGGELDYNLADIELDSATLDANADSLARLKLMAGADLGRALVYATAGGAYAEGSFGGDDFSDNGYFAGVGMDYQLSDTLNVGGEILAHRFDDFDDTGVELEAVTAQVKVAYRF